MERHLTKSPQVVTDYLWTRQSISEIHKLVKLIIFNKYEYLKKIRGTNYVKKKIFRYLAQLQNLRNLPIKWNNTHAVNKSNQHQPHRHAVSGC